MAASHNLPAVLNDPKKGKQRDFFTRSWGDHFTDATPVPPSPHVCEIPARSFDRYLRKLRRHQHRRNLGGSAAKQEPASSSSDPASPTRSSPSAAASSSSSATASQGVNPQRVSANVSHVFLDPNFDLTKPETFASIFPISQEKSFPQQVETVGRLVQEKLSHQLDQVEVSIACQVAQKSHHFFQVRLFLRIPNIFS